MDEAQFSYVRIIVLLELTLAGCYFFYNPAMHLKQRTMKAEQALYGARKRLLEQLIDGLQQEISEWESSFKKESFAREQLTMAQPDEIVYYLSVAK